MSDSEDLENSYLAGRAAAWRHILVNAVSALGYENAKLESLIAEREEAIATLRRVCAEHGDNDWTPELNLRDIIQKHLYRHLEDKKLS